MGVRAGQSAFPQHRGASGCGDHGLRHARAYRGAEALYLEATAEPVAGDARAAALALLNTRLPISHQLGPEDLEPAGPLQVYQAVITRHFVLIRGGDTRFDNVTDARLAVIPPDPSTSPPRNSGARQHEVVLP